MATTNWPIHNTDHGMLIAFGEFLQQHELLPQLAHVPIHQRRRTYAPGTKLVEFLAGIMSGSENLSDMNDGPHPLARDPLVARAWGQERFAHYSGVSRTLAACDVRSVDAIRKVITDFSRPFIQSQMHELRRTGTPIVFDLDLMGQPVSATSTTYPAAAFGWMDDQIQLGYQIARVCVTTRDGQRIWLSSQHHPGDTVSAACLQGLIRAAEAASGMRPRRRSELVQQRQAELATRRERLHRLLTQQQAKSVQVQTTIDRLRAQIWQAAHPPQKPVNTAVSERTVQRAQTWRARLPRLTTQLIGCQRVMRKYQAALDALDNEQQGLQHWRIQLEADNRLNPDPPCCEARMDSGFSSGANLTWLIEMGYQVNSKVTGAQTTNALRATLPNDARWTRVGDNADMLICARTQVHDCPYAVQLALERFKVRDHFQYATLLRFPFTSEPPVLPDWFSAYNARQTMEAGNKESKSGVFHVQHLMSRSAAGIQIQVLFATLAANVIQWAVPWLRTCTTQPTVKLLSTFDSPKHLVRVANNSPALVQQTACGTALQFAPHSALPGAILVLRGVPAFQLPLAPPIDSAIICPSQ